MIPNGRARYAVRKRWRGLAERFGFDPLEERILETPARITRQLVSTSIKVFDRETGANRRARHGLKPSRLLAYQLGDGAWVTVQEAHRGPT